MARSDLAPAGAAGAIEHPQLLAGWCPICECTIDARTRRSALAHGRSHPRWQWWISSMCERYNNRPPRGPRAHR